MSGPCSWPFRRGSGRHRFEPIEDNGPAGDLLDFGSIEPPGTTCPDPTDHTFQPGSVGGFPIGPEIVSGDFVVTDVP